MRIRLKFSLVELAMSLGFFIAVSFSLYYLNSMIQLKNMEFQAEKVSTGLARFNIRTETLLTTEGSVQELMDAWSDTIDDFEKELDLLVESDAVALLGDERVKEVIDVAGWWGQIKNWYLKPVFSHVDGMKEAGLADELGSEGILQSYYGMEEGRRRLTGSIMTLANYRDNVEENTVVFSEKLTELVNGLGLQAESYLADSLRMVFIVVAANIILSAIIVNITTLRISRRIGMVEDAVRTIARGDFSKNLKIKSADEFEELAEHYNTFKGELWKKLDSVLEFMLQIGENISEGLNIDGALVNILDSFMKNTTADAGAVFLLDENQKRIRMVAVQGYHPCPYPVPEGLPETEEAISGHLKNTVIPVGKTVIGKCIKSGEGLFLKSTEGVEDLIQNRVRGSFLYIHSIGLIPLVISGRVLGAVSLVKTDENEAFTDMDFTNIRTFGDYAALAIDNMYNFTEAVRRREIQRELRIASDIQKNLLPRKLPEIPGFQVALHTESAGTMSGDYYDIFRLGPEKTAVVICDVVGRGVPASLLMVMIRTVIRFIASPKRDSDDILNVLNKGLTNRLGTDQYATLSVSVIDHKSHEISFSNAAHSPLLVYRNSENSFIEEDSRGLPVGVESSEQYGKVNIALESGDFAVFYTDGLPETPSPDGSLYTLERLKKNLVSARSGTAEKMVESVHADLTSFRGSADLDDDQTLIVIRAV